MTTRQIEKAQLKVESRNFDIRKQLLEYDDVANDQRKAIYEQRNHLLEHANVSDTVRDMIGGWVEDTVNMHVAPESTEEQWDIAGLEAALHDVHVPVSIAEWQKASPDLDDADIRERCKTRRWKATASARSRAKTCSASLSATSCCRSWIRSGASILSNSTCCARGIHLRGYAQKNPKQEYKRESFEMFGQMLTASVATSYASC